MHRRGAILPELLKGVYPIYAHSGMGTTSLAPERKKTKCRLLDDQFTSRNFNCVLNTAFATTSPEPSRIHFPPPIRFLWTTALVT